MSPSAELIFIVFEGISQCSALENEENQKRGEEKNPDCSRALNYLSARTIKVEGKQEMIPACDIWKHCKFSQCGTRCSDGPRTKTHLPIWPSCANVGWVSQWQAHQAKWFFFPSSWKYSIITQPSPSSRSCVLAWMLYSNMVNELHCLWALIFANNSIFLWMKKIMIHTG